jgi:hypothetical protein
VTLKGKPDIMRRIRSTMTRDEMVDDAITVAPIDILISDPAAFGCRLDM